jgi:hypothetical protein
MKKFEKYGKALSKQEQKKIIGGSEPIEEKTCNTDADCSTGYVCRERATDGVCRCVKGTIG